jgi:methyl-accepting chemotaxis protein
MFPHEEAVTSHISNVITRGASVEISIAVIAYLLVRIMHQSIARADRAEEIGKLQKALLKQEHAVAEQKRALDASIQQIIQTQRRVANGDLEARVPLTQENVLWEVAGSLNNLLNRMRRGIQAEQQIAQLLPRLNHATEVERFLVKENQEVQRFTHQLELNIVSQQPVHYIAHGATILGPIIQLLNGKMIVATGYSPFNRPRAGGDTEPLGDRR